MRRNLARADPQNCCNPSDVDARSRIDPASALVTRNILLPGTPGLGGPTGVPLVPVSQLAVGGGAVWAVNPDLTVSRIDPRTGRLAARIDVVATRSIAAGREGVWVIGKGSSVTRIDEWPICAWRYFGCAPAATMSAA